jgi:hypothetical protein
MTPSNASIIYRLEPDEITIHTVGGRRRIGDAGCGAQASGDRFGAQSVAAQGTADAMTERL